MVNKSLDDEIVQLWKELTPAGAYTCGFEEYAGKLFIPSEENIARALDRVRGLRRRAENDLQSRVLDSMEVVLRPPPEAPDPVQGARDVLLAGDEELPAYSSNPQV